MEVKYEKVDINSIKPNDWNPNEMPQSLLDFLAKQIKEKGFLQPVLVGKNNEIVDGEHRWMAGKIAGEKQISIIRTDMSKEEAKQMTVNMNQIKGNTNPLKLAGLISDLSQDYTLQQIASSLNMSVQEVQSLEDLMKLPNLDDLQDIDVPDIKNEITCPECGHVFEQ